MIIRRAQPSEADVLTKIAVASKSYWGYSAAQIELWRDELTFTAQCIEQHVTFVAEVANKVLAVAQLNVTTQHACLEALWVHPNFVGHGIGKALLSEVLAAARVSGESSIAIDADPNAEAYYRAQGATPSGFLISTLRTARTAAVSGRSSQRFWIGRSLRRSSRT